MSRSKFKTNKVKRKLKNLSREHHGSEVAVIHIAIVVGKIHALVEEVLEILRVQRLSIFADDLSEVIDVEQKVLVLIEIVKRFLKQSQWICLSCHVSNKKCEEAGEKKTSGELGLLVTWKSRFFDLVFAMCIN